MARSQVDLPRMQNQPRLRGAEARGPQLVTGAGDATPSSPRKPQLMRQFELVDRVKEYNPKANEELLNRAYVYAMKAHGEQKRDSGDPYFSHPLQVAAILTDLKLDDATIAAALLHDTIEDTDATRAEIDRLFGHDIGRLVEGLTKLNKLELVSKEAKQAENLRKLLLAIADDVRVLLIKLADRLHNMYILLPHPLGLEIFHATERCHFARKACRPAWPGKAHGRSAVHDRLGRTCSRSLPGNLNRRYRRHSQLR